MIHPIALLPLTMHSYAWWGTPVSVIVASRIVFFLPLDEKRIFTEVGGGFIEYLHAWRVVSSTGVTAREIPQLVVGLELSG